MESIIVYVDDAEWALRQLAPMAHCEGAVAAHWVLVACPPRLTQRIGKWTSHSAREGWRERWSAELFRRIEPSLRRHGHRTAAVIAKSPLVKLTQELVRQHGAVHVLDARRPKFGAAMPAVSPEQAATRPAGEWQLPLTVMGLGAVLTLAAE